MRIQSNPGRAAVPFAITVLAALSAPAVPLHAQGPPPPAFHVTRPSAHDFEETLALLKQAIEAENLMVVHEINAQQMLRMVGERTGGMRQILFFHPRYMKRIIDSNRNGGIEPPLKLLVMETPNGQVMVRYEDPRRQFEAYPGLEEIAAELNTVLETVVAAVAR